MYPYNMFFGRFRRFDKPNFSIHENFYLRRKQYLTQLMLKQNNKTSNIVILSSSQCTDLNTVFFV